MNTLNPVNKPYLLSKICESNFHKLRRLAPDLSRISHSATALVTGNPALHLKLLKRSPYTLTLELTHCFDHEDQNQYEPLVRIQVYLDARSVEVLHDNRRSEATVDSIPIPSAEDILNTKWNSNYFLQKWLNHCLASGYQFQTTADRIPENTLDSALPQ